MGRSIINVISIGIMLIIVFVFFQKHKDDLGLSRRKLSSFVLLISLSIGSFLIWALLKWLMFILETENEIPFGYICFIQLLTSVFLFFSVGHAVVGVLTTKNVCKNFIFILYMELILSIFSLGLYFVWFFPINESLFLIIFINGVAIASLVYGLKLFGKFIDEKKYDYIGTTKFYETANDISHSQGEDAYHYSDEYTSGYTAGRDAASSNTESTHDNMYSSFDSGYNDGVNDYEESST